MGDPATRTPGMRRHSFEEYVRLEEFSNVRHEFLDGAIYAMAGGTVRHGMLAARVSGALSAQLDGRPCEPLGSDFRIRVQATGLGTYPDVSVVCGPPQRDPADPDTVVNPTVLVEVLSDSTEEYDRTVKRDHYVQIPALREYVLVSQHEPRVEVWRRAAGTQWACETYEADAQVVLASLGCVLDLGKLYRDLPPE